MALYRFVVRKGIRLLSLGTLAMSAVLLGQMSQAQSIKVDGRYESESGNITMALSGDTLVDRPFAQFREERFLKLRDLFLNADVGFTNGETLFHNYENTPTSLTGVWERANPSVIKDLQWMGINLLSSANNHAYDFGEDGILTNIRYLNAAGIVHAGTGANYADAVAPAYLETTKGRVALVAATTSGNVASRAGEQNRYMKGRPGVNFIRWLNEWTVDPEAFDAMKRVAQQYKWEQGDDPVRAYAVDKSKSAITINFSDRNLGMPPSDKAKQFLDDPPARFVLGATPEQHTYLHLEDLRRNVKSVSDAHRMGDWVIYSVHNHEFNRTNDEPSDHVVALAHAVIDAGADVFVGHGPNITRGIEIYKGRVIFYSLGNLFREETVSLAPEEAMPFYGLGYENSVGDYSDAREATDDSEARRRGMLAIIAVTKFEDKKLRRIELYPIDMGFGLPRSQYGRPVLAQGVVAQEILERIQRLSAPFHTNVQINGDVGIIQLQ
jgi:poly-gamma-glutamate capsule biosynthesis protein CapA/YwtB (metallophosphatase superfamily)